jgi:hypothetical protein
MMNLAATLADVRAPMASNVKRGGEIMSARASNV